MICKPLRPQLFPYVKQINQFSLQAKKLFSFIVVPTGNVFITLFSDSSRISIHRPSSKVRVNEDRFITGQQHEIAHHKIERNSVNCYL